jgi:hypothetical protein
MLPSPALLDAPPGPWLNERELMDSARLLGQKYREFGVAGSVVRQVVT